MSADRNFQVDLRGVVDLLSHHLYSSPRVYLRELMQNAVDAVTARRVFGPLSGDEAIRISVDGGRLSIVDSGIGLTEPQVHELLATIGRSSKRDDLGFARHEFLGQFGIGLLSAFLVADEVEVVTRADGAGALRWIGRGDGTYRIEPADRVEAGTTVILNARGGAREWFDPRTVRELATLFGSMLPVEVSVNGEVITGDGPPWLRTGADRAAGLVAHAQDVFGWTPFDAIELDVPEAGLTGVAYVLPFPANPAEHGGHRVHLKRMLLAENTRELVPDWAFFVRCVVDAAELRPTAGREALYDDGLLHTTREAIGAQIRGWLVRLARIDPDRLGRFLSVHHLGVKAMALHDDEMLRLVDQWWPVETNVGGLTLAEFRDRHRELRYTSTAEDFRQLAAVAAAQDLPLINGGYTYDAELIERVGALESVPTHRLDPTDLATRFEPLDSSAELDLRGFLTAARASMDRLGCEVVLRSFDPANLPVLYLIDRSAAFQRELRATRERLDDLWAGVLSAFDKPVDHRPRLVLNFRNDLVRRMTALADPELIGLAVEALYGQALLLGHHPLRPADSALLNRAFIGLLDHAVPTKDRT